MFLKKKLMYDRGIFSSYKRHKERRTGKIRRAYSGLRFFKDVQGFERRDAGSHAGFTSSRHFNFLYFCTMCVDLLTKIDWSVICPLCC